ncbi:MAG: glycosyltransferase family 39 protein, partial [Candidatus Omnitrophica bacterium]|nr:glycosyltransferase family 39 protein [Candidatus Omnitrophota bacterium]
MKKLFLVIALLVFIWAAAASVRVFTFWLPHWQGDQSQYVMLAMKMDQLSLKGFQDYNLRSVKVRILRPYGLPGVELVAPEHTEKKELGEILEVYNRLGLGYYDMPVFYKAPLLPAILAFAHQTLTVGNHPFMVVRSNLGEQVLRDRPPILFQAQFWAAIVPYAASLLVVLLTFGVARLMFGNTVALFAAWILAFNPVNLLTAHRIWTEDVMTFFMVASALLYWFYYHRRNTFGVFMAGVLLGYAVLTNQKALLLVPVVYVHTVLTHKQKLWNLRKLPHILINRDAIFFVLGMLLISGTWFDLMNRVYHNPFFQPKMVRDESQAAEWIKLLRARPHAAVVYTLGVMYLCPPLTGIWLSLKKTLKEIGSVFSKTNRMVPAIFCWMWVGIFFWYHLYRGA